MAYIKPELLGSAGRRPPIHRKKALIQEIRSHARPISKMGKQVYDGGRIKRPSPSRASIPPGGFDLSGDIMQMPQRFQPGPPSGYGAGGEGWQAQVAAGGPDPYSAPADGPFPPMPAQHPAFTGMPRPPFRGQPALPPGFGGGMGNEPQHPRWEGKLNQQALIQMIMQQLMGQRASQGFPGMF